MALIIQAASLAFSVIQANKNNRARKESSSIQTAAEKISNRASQRRALREKRFKEANILQAGENLGFSGSSLALGAQSSLAANLANNFALQSFSKITKEGLTKQNQKIADAESASKTFSAFGDLLGTYTDSLG